MLRGLYTAASGMISRQIQSENLSNNVSNINTPGYKKQKVVLKSFEELLIQNKDKYIGEKCFKRNLGTMELGVGIDDTVVDFSQGVLEKTDRDLDFAIDGKGFFTLVDDNGNIKYTRDGRFILDKEGYLKNIFGYKVLGNDGRPIRINSKEINVNDINFLITDFDDKSQLKKDMNNMFLAQSQGRVVNSNIKQGYLEKSNVDTIEVITEMISIMRSFESNQKVIQVLDETLGKTVNDIGSIK
ncbi:flagellar basal-body rod protein FlgG [Caloramator fervidus]|uniref:Flagellar basal-body rod protein FlgG n=1 Tax=Caloramator fervidus TaxID=29344 RepID=A0A1H5SAC5_9CLOT|nr:flagellar hook-basal body complex protein [Caloramator fervidus]SEF47593.1 flagellar basal-body rod protein FlgG [Caloramator fervidus]